MPFAIYDSMRDKLKIALIVVLLPLAASATACGAKTINKKTAHAVIAGHPSGVFDKDDVEITSAAQIGSNQALVEVQLRAALTLKRDGSEWAIDEARLGKHQWERLDDLLAALQQFKIRAAHAQLEEVAAGVESFWSEHRALPSFTDYVSLADTLSPRHMSPLIRLDPWRIPLAAEHAGPGSVRLISAGPDRIIGTADDISLVRAFPR